MKLHIVLALISWSGMAGAQTTVQVGDVVVGTCDTTQANTQLDEADVYTPQGQLVTSFHGPQQNSCLTGMTFDATGNAQIISAFLGTTNWKILRFDGVGNLLGQAGPFSSPVSITHDQTGNFFLGAGSVLKLAPNGSTSNYTVAGGASGITMTPDQQTIVYSSAANGDVKSFNLSTATQGPDWAVGAVARMVRMLPDASILLDSNGSVARWVRRCAGCYPYKRFLVYQIPANADTFTLDPDGASFWSINTFYDSVNQLGEANVYRMNIKTGELMASFSLQPLTNGRYYSGSIGVVGDGMNSTASATASLTFPGQAIGTTSPGKLASITNTGVVAMVVSKVAVTGDFEVAKNLCASGILPGASCTVSVTFSPTHTGTRSGTLTVFDNASGSPQSVALSGIGKGATNTTISSSLNPSIFGQVVTLTAQVTSNGGSPTGTVAFLNGTKSLGKGTLSGGFASLTTTKIPVGNISIVGSYSGDTLNVKSTSAPISQSVSQASTTTTVMSSRNPSTQGQTVKFTAVVQSATVVPTGSVTFFAGATTLGTVNLGNGKASLSVTTLPRGQTTVTAVYSGTANITGSSGFVLQIVN